MQLRPYQKDALNAVCLHLKYNASANGYVLAPGGSGKSVMISFMADYLARQGHRVVVLARSERLIDQNHDKAPNKDICGIYCAGLGRQELDKQITYATIQSIYNKKINPNYIILDECHDLSPDKENNTQYWHFIRQNNNPVILGFTATDFRTGSGEIGWGEKIYHIGIQPLVDAGHLVPPTNKLSHSPDTSDIKIVAGEFSAKGLDKIYDDTSLLDLSIKKILQYHRNRSIVFSQNIPHGRLITENLNANGLSTIFVDGNTPKDDLRKILELHEQGTYKVLVNCMLATTGYDLPWLDMVAIIRATNSKVLFEQMCFRGTRPYPNKTNFILLDMGGNLERHGPLGSPYKGKAKKEKNAPSPGRLCPSCETYAPLTATECPDCGFVFPEPEDRKINHDDRVDTSSSVIYTADPYRWYDVKSVRFSLSKTKKGVPCIIASFFIEGYFYPSIKKWLMPHHESSFARGAFLAFMKRMGDDIYVGSDNSGLRQYSMDDLLWRCENKLNTPTRIKVDEHKDFHDIVDYEFYSEEEPQTTEELLDDEIPINW